MGKGWLAEQMNRKYFSCIQHGLNKGSEAGTEEFKPIKDKKTLMVGTWKTGC